MAAAIFFSRPGSGLPFSEGNFGHEMRGLLPIR